MYLKSLEINGFKSFAEKTVLEFPRGIISIVGPNGSGKSNILDAVIWVLGEQSYKSIRAKESSDIIFSGGKNTKSKNFAEVSITINNESKFLNVDYNEIKITRRIFVSGENEYFINNVKSRLKDIQELFLDTGIGKSAYSVIGQGKVEEILLSNSKDLKLIIEEAAGIKKSKKRKEESEEKLAEVSNNIEKIEYIEEDIKIMLDPLKEQAEKATLFKELKSKLRLKNGAILKKELFFKENQINGLKFKISESEKKIDLMNIELENLKNELRNISENIKQYEMDIEEYEKKLSDLNSEVRKLSNEYTLYNERISNFEKEKSEKELLLLEIKEKYKNKEAKLRSLFEEGERLKAEVDSEAQIIEETINKRNELLSKLDYFEKELKKNKDLIVDEEIKRIKNSNEKENLEKNIKIVNVKIEKLKIELSENQGKYSNLEKNLEILKTKEIIMEQQFENVSNEKSILIKKRDNFIKQLEEVKKSIELKERIFQDKKVRIEAQIKLENSYEGFFKSVKEIVNLGLEGVYGPFLSLINIPKKFEIAIESAVGNNLQDIVVEDSNVAKKCIEFLKQNKLGRASFLPFDTIKVFESSHLISMNEKGIFGFANELVEYDPKYFKVVKFVLGNLVVAENIDIALEFFKKSNFSGSVVSLDGEVISGKGKISGGEKLKSNISLIFERRHEIEKLTEDLKIIEKELEELYNKLEKINKEITIIRNNENEVDLKLRNLSEDKYILKKDIELISKQIEEVSKILKTINFEIIEESKRSNEFENRINLLKESIGLNSQSIIEYKSLCSKYEDLIKSLTNELNFINSNFSEKSIEYAKIKETLKSTKEKISEENGYFEDIKNELRNCEDKILLAREHILEYTEKSLSVKKCLEELNSTFDSVLSLFKKKKEELKEIEHIEKSKIMALKELENKYNIEKSVYIKNLKDIEKLNEEIIELNLKLEELGDIKDIEIPSNESLVKKEIIELEHNIKSLGDVNLLAIEEYSKLKARYDFIINQKNDLINSRDALKNLIKDIENEIVIKFSTAFESIKGNFSYTCSELLSNAKGTITLSNPDDILNTGVELEVKFKDKKSQTLTLLSGGEKSMVAVAFIMAIFMYRPAPFTFFDEIEAALDESNTKKLLKLLRSFVNNSQFILITHNKETMRESDLLYGVTMNKEEGISKVVSVNIMN